MNTNKTICWCSFCLGAGCDDRNCDSGAHKVCKGTGWLDDDNRECTGGVRAHAEEYAEAWGDVMQLATPVERFPLHALPPVLRAVTETVAATFEVPVDLPAATGLGVVSAATRGHVRIRHGSDWVETANLYMVAALESGEAKSPVMNIMTAPLFDAQRTLTEEGAEERHHKAALRKQAEAEVELAEKNLKKSNYEGDAVTELARATQRLDSISKTNKPLLMVGADTTPESIPSVLEGQEGVLAIVTDEGADLFAAMGRYQGKKGDNIGIFLAGKDDRPYNVHRKGADPITLDRCCLTLVLAVQTSALSELRGDGKNGDRGLLGRMQYSVPESLIGYRPRSLTPLDRDAVGAYNTLVQSLVIDGKDVTLTLADEAAAMFEQWRHRLEVRLRPGADLCSMRTWANKLPGDILVIAALLHIVEFESDDTIVKAGTMRQALSLSSYFITHARRAFGEMQVDPALTLARRIGDFIAQSEETTITKRQMHRAIEHHVTQASDLNDPIALLCDRAWLRPVPTQVGPKGGRPSDVYEINPKIKTLKTVDTTDTTPTQDSYVGSVGELPVIESDRSPVSRQPEGVAR